MAKLYLRGILKPVTISKQQAQNLVIIDDDSKISGETKYTLNGTRFAKKDIKNIIEDDVEDNNEESAAKRKEENAKHYEQMNSEYVRQIAILCDKSADVKAKDTRVYELVWGCFTSKPVTQDFLAEVVKRQEVFYSTHPKHPYASINVYDLIPRDKFPEYSLNEVMPNFISTKVLHIISEAFNTAKAIHKI